MNPNTALTPATHAAPAGRQQAEAPPQQALWAILQRQVALYTGCDSTSLPVETAHSLLQSVLFCIEQGDAALGAEAATQTPGGRLLAGQRALTRKTAAAQRLLAKAEQTATPIENRGYHDTLGALRQFFIWYDIRFFAHDIPCMIDYPLCLPVPDTLYGVCYIEAYLRQLLFENRVLAFFSTGALRGRLSAHCGDYRGLLVNLCEPVLASALGLALLGRPVQTLSVSPAERHALYTRLKGGHPQTMEAQWLQAAAHLCTRLRLWSSDTRRRVTLFAHSMLPRLQAADEAGWAALFPTCRPG